MPTITLKRSNKSKRDTCQHCQTYTFEMFKICQMSNMQKQSKAVQINATQCNEMETRGKQFKGMQSNAKTCKAMRSKSKQCTALQSNAKKGEAMHSKATQGVVAAARAAVLRSLRHVAAALLRVGSLTWELGLCFLRLPRLGRFFLVAIRWPTRTPR